MDVMNKAEGFAPSAEDTLRYLLRSKTIRAVLRKDISPKGLDRMLKHLEDENAELKRIRMLDQSEIVRLRRQVEFLIGHDNAEV